jgi:hypothetical protein
MQIFGTTKKNHVLLSKNTKRGKPKKRSIGQGREWNYNCKIGQSSSKCHDDVRKKGLEQQQQQTPVPKAALCSLPIHTKELAKLSPHTSLQYGGGCIMTAKKISRQKKLAALEEGRMHHRHHSQNLSM